MDIGVFGIHHCNLPVGFQSLFLHVVCHIKLCKDGIIPRFLRKCGDQLLYLAFRPLQVVQMQVYFLLLKGNLFRNTGFFINKIIGFDGILILLNLQVKGCQLIKIIEVSRIFCHDLFINVNRLIKLGSDQAKFTQKK